MAITEYENGTETLAIGVEVSLNTTSPDTTGGVYQFFVDTTAMQSGDTLILRVKEKTRSTTAQGLVFGATVSDTQSEPQWVSPALILLHGWDFTLAQTTGTGRAFPWSIRRVS